MSTQTPGGVTNLDLLRGAAPEPSSVTVTGLAPDPAAATVNEAAWKKIQEQRPPNIPPLVASLAERLGKRPEELMKSLPKDTIRRLAVPIIEREGEPVVVGGIAYPTREYDAVRVAGEDVILTSGPNARLR